MRHLLFISNLFPDSGQPIRGLDNASLLHSLGDDWDIRVLSPRTALPPWRSTALRPREEDSKFSPSYVTCPYLPKIGSWCNDWLMAWALAPALERLIKEFKPDAILCSWLYPDGCAVVRLAKRHRVPVVLVTQGTDTHQYLKIPQRRRKIVSAIQRSEAVICRSANLAHRLQAAGGDAHRFKVIYNGVDTEIFQPRDQAHVRSELKISMENPVLLFVGNYLPVKNPLLLIGAHAELNRRRGERGEPSARLVLIGDGPLRPDMAAAVNAEGSGDFVSLLFREAPREVARWMNAADLLCLSSHNEGFPNVILEAMACDLRVVSTDVGGIGELVNRPERGFLVKAGDLNAYVGALERALGGTLTPRQNGERDKNSDYSWSAAADSYRAVIESAIKSQ